MKSILILLFFVTPTSVFCQKVDSVKLAIASYYPEARKEGRSSFILRITNDSKQTIRIPSRFMAATSSTGETNIIADIYYNGAVQSKDCDISGRVYLDEGFLLKANESYLIQPPIVCYDFVPGDYKIRFRFDGSAAMLYGETNWFNFKIE